MTSPLPLRRARLPRFLLLAFLFAACAPAMERPSSAGEVPLRADAVPLILERLDARRVGRLEYLAGFALTSSDPRFGGLSALEISADGERLLAVSDLGHWFRARLNHDRDGRLLGLEAAEILPFRDLQGAVIESKEWGDAESLAIDAEGGLLVGFEGRHRIWRYVSPESSAAAIRFPTEVTKLPGNAGIEAMAILGNGDLVLLSEGVADANGDSMGWLRQGENWSRIAVAKRDDFRPTGLARLPSGDLLLLERHFHVLTGVKARLSLIHQGEIRPGARILPERLAELASPMTVDNFEGLAARRTADGRTLVYLLSDDNKNPLQRTLLLQFILLEAGE